MLLKGKNIIFRSVGLWNSKDIQNLRQSVLKLKNSQTEIIFRTLWRGFEYL